eukprot:CAMPEP_0172067922 /NCGR_PEP_ID=MMETSP1043-20130122/11944_1 /TAXON_ID=464988 /ORGANISM="Hemiselmis andersenii, Strain CCMP441" /LENGTH=258 /DNA_ID=CAMNT_0012728163 /DNA_START=41 /DNA_END=814 /DNA_ORIENTATION=+
MAYLVSILALVGALSTAGAFQTSTGLGLAPAARHGFCETAISGPRHAQVALPGVGTLKTPTKVRTPGMAMSSTMTTDIAPTGIDGDLGDVGGSTGVEEKYATCGTCKASYILDLEELGAGRKVKCAVCDHTWFQSAARLQTVRSSDKVQPFPVEEFKERQKALGNVVTRHDRKGAVTLFVGNMPFSITEDKLKGVFEEYGEVASISIICDPATGRPKGYGFVDYVEKDCGEVAMNQIDGMLVDGRELAVKISEDKFGG